MLYTTGTCPCSTAAHHYKYQLVIFLTCPYYSITPKILPRYVYHAYSYFSTWYIHDYVWYWWPDVVVFHPSCTYIVFLGAIYRSYVVTDTSALSTVNTANVWGSIALLILVVYHRVQTNEYSPILTYRHLFLLYYMRWPSRSYTCTSYHTFRSSFGRTAKLKIWPIRHWGGEAHSTPSTSLFTPEYYCTWLYCMLY